MSADIAARLTCVSSVTTARTWPTKWHVEHVLQDRGRGVAKGLSWVDSVVAYHHDGRRICTGEASRHGVMSVDIGGVI
mgnify:CR=1 FL=1